MTAYADTSFLVSLYSLDTNSRRAAAEIARLKPALMLTPLGELELANALELRIFRREATRSQVNAIRSLINEHIATGFLSLQLLPATIYDRARQISRRQTARLGLRTLDILHVACALLLHADLFLSFDLRQRELALAQRLKTN